MQFTRLKITGFKSFVEPTEVHIEPGLTGVVGPNGCGKSNLVEALRWVMGETSAKKMRGGAMDDVIFSGTATRPSRNLAEVTLVLDNSDRQAPAQFNETDEIEITRQIARESGSTYRINGREVRAKDVQLLFADLATGAHSTAMVSQGRVGALIGAKPTERRALLEEAAGITGLHSRRHEAELRLRAADTNLERLDDVIQSLESQLQGLKRQARQATRYRNISGHIRRAESIMFHLRWTAAVDARDAVQAKLAELEAKVAELTQAAAAASTAQANAGQAVPPLREKEAEAAASLHRLSVARENLDAEEQRAKDATAQLQQRLEQIGADSEREQHRKREAEDNMARLQEEAGQLTAGQAAEADARAEADDTLAECQRTLASQQTVLDDVSQRVAQVNAQRQAIERQIRQAEQQIERFDQRLRQIGEEHEALIAQGGGDGGEALDVEITGLKSRSDAAHDAAENAERKRLESQGVEAEARDTLQSNQSAVAKLQAEERALAELVADHSDEMWPPLIDAITVTPGLEAALGAALGDDLQAPADEAAPVHWRSLPPLAHTPPLPAGADALSNHVKAPDALSRRLSQIGIVDAEQAAALVPQLVQGQRLVSKDGTLWRWDGFVAGAEGTAAAARLAQRNRLEEVRVELTDAERRLAAAQGQFDKAKADVARAASAEKDARETARQADRALRDAQGRQTQAAAAEAARRSKIASLQENAESTRAEREEAIDARRDATEAAAELPQEDVLHGELTEARRATEQLRETTAEARAERDRIVREAETRAKRLGQIEQEKQAWQLRSDDAERQTGALTERREDARTELASWQDKPAEIAAQRAALLDRIGEAESVRNEAADALAQAENDLAERDKALRMAEQALGESRENRARLQSDAEHAGEVLTDLTQRIREELECEPQGVLAAAEIKEDEELPDLESTERKLERLKKERDNMGPVNLRADMEAQEVGEQIESLLSERSDLEAAIAKLRQAISNLNREGRQRLLAAFEEVDKHFQELFVRMFGGGQAHLKLTESDDPLEAGLEILASPPGKRLQVMSLLSGGEQALTALSLLFAVFLTNPAPICVLDEVDAPLDDTNVERLCNLVEELGRSGATRFLTVTHNPISMAAMDRLYGVTMAERGISQLVSVDLEAAEAMRESA